MKNRIIQMTIAVIMAGWWPTAHAQSIGSVPGKADTAAIVDEGAPAPVAAKDTVATDKAGQIESAPAQPGADEYPVQATEEVVGGDERSADRESEMRAKEPIEKAGEPRTLIIPGNGIGMNFGLRIFSSDQLNRFVDAVNDTTIAILQRQFGPVNTQDTTGNAGSFAGITLRLKGEIHPIDYLGIEPAITWLVASKTIKYSITDIFHNTVYRDSSTITLSDLSLDVNFWAKPLAHKRVSFKAGLGLSYGTLSLVTEGFIGNSTMQGAGVGANILAGLDVTFPRVTINVDFLVPIASRNLTRSNGHLAGNFSTITLPTTVGMAGLEIRPGVTIHFGRAERVIGNTEK